MFVPVVDATAVGAFCANAMAGVGVWSCLPLVLGAVLAAGTLVGMVPVARPLAPRNANAQIFRLGGIPQPVAQLIASYMPNGPNQFVMATNPLHFLASRTQAQAFRAGVGRWMRRREFFTGMYTFLAHKAKNGISDQCLEHIAGLLACHKKTGG